MWVGAGLGLQCEPDASGSRNLSDTSLGSLQRWTQGFVGAGLSLTQKRQDGTRVPMETRRSHKQPLFGLTHCEVVGHMVLPVNLWAGLTIPPR